VELSAEPFRYLTEGSDMPVGAAAGDPALVVGDVCVLSGQIALDSHTGALIEGSAADELEQALANLFAVAADVGFAPGDIALIVMVVTDVGQLPALNAVYAAALPEGHRPARMTFQASALPHGARVEVQGIAMRQPG
jgi:2-iminobutanoate/2-iminopropanoate deaminase